MYNHWLHRVAVLTAVMTFILICMGGLVTSTDSGLAVPDWPTTFGYNMFLYPLSKTVSGFLFSIDPNLQTDLEKGNLSENLRSALENNAISISESAIISTEVEGERWRLTDGENERIYTLINSDSRLDVYVHGVLYEHTHRLIGAIVGVLTIVLLVAIWAKDDRGWLKLLSVIALVAVIAQGVMGGLRVTHLSRALAIVHACFAQVFFGTDRKHCAVHFARMVANLAENRRCGCVAPETAKRHYISAHLCSIHLRCDSEAYRDSTRCPSAFCRLGDNSRIFAFGTGVERLLGLFSACASRTDTQRVARCAVGFGRRGIRC